jgi:hypothetical protein
MDSSKANFPEPDEPDIIPNHPKQQKIIQQIQLTDKNTSSCKLSLIKVTIELTCLALFKSIGPGLDCSNKPLL